jgi:hypothetical protein
VKPDYGRPVHPVCDLFPLMDATSLAELAADIKANGLLSAIVLHEGAIVDGRNRLLACRKAGVEPRFEEWGGEMAVDSWIWSLNVKRRHLTPDQIAWAVAERRGWQVREASVSREKLGKSADGAGGRGRKANRSVDPPAGLGETREILAKEAGVSTNKVRQALEVQKLAAEGRVAPEAMEQLKNGTVKLCEVIKSAAPLVPKPATEPATAPAPAKRKRKGPSTGSKRESMLDGAAKVRLVRALSVIGGACRGLATLSVPSVRRSCLPEELTTWAAIARNASTDLNRLSSKLKARVEEKK